MVLDLRLKVIVAGGLRIAAEGAEVFFLEDVAAAAAEAAAVGPTR